MNDKNPQGNDGQKAEKIIAPIAIVGAGEISGPLISFSLFIERVESEKAERVKQ